MNLNKILKKQKKYKELSKEVKILINRNFHKKNLINEVIALVSFITGAMISILFSFNLLIMIISFFSIFFCSIFLSNKLLMNYKKRKYKAVTKTGLFYYPNKELNDYCKKYKKELKIYKIKNKGDLLFQIIKESINKSTKKEIEDNALLLKDYLLYLGKSNVEGKKELEDLIAKKMGSFNDNKEEEEEINKLLNIKENIKIVENI